MKTPREVAHALAHSHTPHGCMPHDELGWSHGWRCEELTDGFIARDAEHEAEKAALRQQLAAVTTKQKGAEIYQDFLIKRCRSLAEDVEKSEASGREAGRREAFGEAVRAVEDPGLCEPAELRAHFQILARATQPAPAPTCGHDLASIQAYAHGMGQEDAIRNVVQWLKGEASLVEKDLQEAIAIAFGVAGKRIEALGKDPR
jgi:hypothetical protein